MCFLACTPGSPDGVALTGATLIDGTGGPPLADAVVVVRRGKIESLGTRAGFELPKRTSEVDLRGRWIIPGLVALGSGTLAALGVWALYRRRHPPGSSRQGRSPMAH